MIFEKLDISNNLNQCYKVVYFHLGKYLSDFLENPVKLGKVRKPRRLNFLELVLLKCTPFSRLTK